MVSFLFNTVIYVFLLLCLCILIVCLCMATLTEVFPCFFLSCKANARVKPAKTGTARTLPNFCVVLCIVFVYMCMYYCHRLASQLQLTNISISYLQWFAVCRIPYVTFSVTAFCLQEGDECCFIPVNSSV